MDEYQIIGPGSKSKVMKELNKKIKAQEIRGCISHAQSGDNISVFVRMNPPKPGTIYGQ